MERHLPLSNHRWVLPAFALAILTACAGTNHHLALRDACEKQYGVGNCVERDASWVPLASATTTSTEPTTTTSPPTSTTPSTTSPPTTVSVAVPAPTPPSTSVACPTGHMTASVTMTSQQGSGNYWYLSFNGTVHNGTSASVSGVFVTMQIAGAGGGSGTGSASPDGPDTLAAGQTVSLSGVGDFQGPSEPRLVGYTPKWAWTNSGYVECPAT